MGTATLTGHQLHKVANELLKDKGFDEIPPQMVYNYIKQGRIAVVDADTLEPIEYATRDKTRKYVVTLDEARRWVRDFVGGKRGSSNSMAELLKEFNLDDEVEELSDIDDEAELEDELS
jgi:hypothetical protein